MVDRPLEARIGEGRDTAAALADHVVVMIATGVAPFEARGLTAEVDPLHEPQFLELLKRPVDARPTDAPQASIHLERRQRTGLPREELDHLASGTAAAVAGAT